MAFVPVASFKLFKTSLFDGAFTANTQVNSTTFRPKTFVQISWRRGSFSATPSHSSTLPRNSATMVSSQGTKLPQLFVYDHCPFCVRVRHAFGFKGMKYNLVWLLNDDVETPTSLVGRKMVPIFQPDGPDGKAMGESLDICKLVNEDPRFGQTSSIRLSSGRTDIFDRLDALADPLRRLTRPRFALAKTLPEFTFEDGRAAFVRNHQLKSEPVSFDENLAKSDEYISKVAESLPAIDDMIHSPESISEGGFSFDDIVAFPKLRSLTIIKGLQLPPKIRAYIEYQSEMASIPLYDHIAM